MRTNETAGIAGMIQALFEHRRDQPFSWSTSSRSDAVRVAVDEQHDRQADADLGGRDRDDEQREHLAGDRVVERRERDEVDVHRVEHELDAHEHEHGVLAREHAVDAGAEQERARG